jgi:hypothetical protein
MTLEEQVKEIQDKCLNREISPVNAVDTINDVIGGITAVYFNNGMKFKIDNHQAKFALKYEGLRNSQMELLYAMAALAYNKAKENGNIFPGEVHIGRGASTKHYMAGIKAILAKYLPQAG